MLRSAGIIPTPAAFELRPNPGPELLDESLRWTGWIGVGLFLLIVTLIGLLGYRLRRKSRPTLPPLPADAALSALNQIEGSAENTPALGKIGAILRRYAQSRFQLPASHLTTAEFETELCQSNLLVQQHKDLLMELLVAADVVKFTNIGSTPLGRQEFIDAARRFVRETA